MTREEHLSFCRVCESKKFDSTKGIICNLTNDIADFETECEYFKGDKAEVVMSDSKKKEVGELDEKVLKFLKRILPKDGFIITPIIAALSIILFIIMSISGVHVFEPDIESLLIWGANFKPVTLNGQYWRIISNCFVHIGLMHLIFNMYALIYIGILLEPIIGKYKFGIAYLIAGISASVVSLWWNDLVVSAGASGAIFGMYGLYIALLSTRVLKQATDKKLLISMLVFVGYNLLYGLKGGIDNAAHIGGLLSGILIGFSIVPSLSKPLLKFRNNILFLVSILGLFIFSVSFIVTDPNTVGKYNNLMEDFAKYEEKALTFYSISPYSGDAVYMEVITKDGIPNWKRCKSVINKIKSIEGLSDELSENAGLLGIYCDYRIESYNLIGKSIELKTSKYDLHIMAYHEEIDLIIRKLSGANLRDKSIKIEASKDLIDMLPDEMLYVVNGKPIENEKDIIFDKIESVVFIQMEEAYDIYGEIGNRGAILIEIRI